MLTPEEIWLFHHNGFLVVEDRLDAETLERLREACDRNVREMVEPIVWEAGDERRPDTVRRISKLLDRDPVFMEVAASDAILEPLADLLGPNVELLTNRHNHLMVRPPGSEVVPWHHQVWGIPYVSVLVYLDGSTWENGAVRVIPGSHRFPFPRAHRFTPEEIAADPLFRQYVTAPVPAGGLLIFYDHLLHSAGPNRSAGPRRSMTLAYCAVDELGSAQPPNRICARGERVYAGHRGEQN